MSIFVNKVEITEAEVGQEIQYHPAPTQERAWQMAAQSLVVRQLLLQQAANSGLDIEEPEENLIDRLLQQDVTVPEADEATCLRFYDTHPDSFMDDESGKRLAFDWRKPLFATTCIPKPCVWRLLNTSRRCHTAPISRVTSFQNPPEHNSGRNRA